MTMSRQVSFEDILLALQQAALQQDHWPVASGLIEEASGVKGNALMVCSHPAIRPGSVCFWRVCFGKERYGDLEREFIEDHWLVDERVPRVRRLGDGVLVPISDLYTPEERETSPTYTELMGKNDMQKGLHARLDVPDGLQIVWALGDSTDTRGWSTTQTATIEKLMPHLRHFAAVRQVLADAKALNRSLVQLLDDRRTCVVQLDRTGRIVEANDHGALALQGDNGLLDAGSYLHARVPQDNARLQQLLAAALPQSGTPGSAGHMTVGRAARSRLLVHVTPVPEQQADFQVAGRPRWS